MDHFNRALSKNNNNNNNSMIVHNNNNSNSCGGRDEREGCRSLICDANGIIIAEMVYRCMICSAVADSIADAKIHYHNNHIDADAGENGAGSCSDPLMFPDEELDLDLTSDDENNDHHHHSQSQHHSSPAHSRRLSYHHSSNTPLSSSSGGGGGAGAATGGAGNYSFGAYGHRNDSDMKQQATSGGRKKIARSKAPLPAPAAASVSSAATGPEVKIQTSGTNGTCTIKSGYITCPVCSCTKFYTTLQRRYGQFSCVGCYRFFKEFFVKPKRYGCPNLGTCPLDVRTKCKGCWIQKCIETYSVDEQRKSLLTAHRPVRKGAAVKSSIKQEQQQSQVRVVAGSHSSHNNSNNNNNSSSNFNNSSSSPGIDSGNENIEPDADGLGDEDEDEDEDDSQYHAQQQHHPTSGAPDAKRIKTEPRPDLMSSTASMNGTEDDDEDNSLEEDPDDFAAEKADGGGSEGSSLLLPAGSVAAIAAVTAAAAAAAAAAAGVDPDLAFDSPSSSLMESSSRDHTPPPTRSGKTPPRRKTSGRIKNWCCLKCANCLADDCGKCINCLDRPKFGGPFIRKQRCLYKKCLMKTKPIPNNSSF